MNLVTQNDGNQNRKLRISQMMCISVKYGDHTSDYHGDKRHFPNARTIALITGASQDARSVLSGIARPLNIFTVVAPVSGTAKSFGA